MNRAGKLLVISIALGAALPGFATESATTQVETTGQGYSSTETTTLSAAEQARARLWNLSETEWSRYQTLMHGKRNTDRTC